MKLTKSETGQQAFKSRSPLFSARQRTAFIMFDGQKSVEQVLAATTSLGLTPEDVDHMVGHGFLSPAPGEAILALTQAAEKLAVQDAADAYKARSPQERYTEGKAIATKLTAALGLRGFRLNLAVESAGGYDELLKLLPKIRDAAGVKACEELEQVLTA